MAPLSIDMGVADTLRVIDGILARRGSERAAVWQSLGSQLQAALDTVAELDRMYYSLLAEVEDIFEHSPLSLERITDVIDQAGVYCTDERLIGRLIEWRSAIQAAAFNPALKQRRYRDIAATLRSIDDPLGRYIERLWNLQNEDISSVRERLQQIGTGNLAEVPAHDQRWDLRTVLELLKLVAASLADDGQYGQDLPSPAEACEEAVRNYDRALYLALAALIGHARQDLAMDRL
jgi:hypothetical protein